MSSRVLRRVCAFCGSKAGRSDIYARAANELGAALGEHGLGLVYGGGAAGLMGGLADSALAHGVEVVGVIPETLLDLEPPHMGLSELRVVRNMHERKALMAELADGFLALPGGFGTLEEFCEAITWTQLGIHSKPGVLVDVQGYYQPLAAMFDRATAEGFIPVENRSLVLMAETPTEAIEQLRSWLSRTPALTNPKLGPEAI